MAAEAIGYDLGKPLKVKLLDERYCAPYSSFVSFITMRYTPFSFTSTHLAHTP
jgi:hypothetical protein